MQEKNNNSNFTEFLTTLSIEKKTYERSQNFVCFQVLCIE